MLPVLIDEEGGAELFVAGLKTVPQCGPLFLGQGHDGTDQPQAGGGIMHRLGAQLHDQTAEGLQHRTGRGEKEPVADIVLTEVVLHTAETGHQQVHLSAVPNLFVVQFERLIPVRGVHCAPVDGGGAQERDTVPEKDRVEIYWDLRPVEVNA